MKLTISQMPTNPQWRRNLLIEIRKDLVEHGNIPCGVRSPATQLEPCPNLLSKNTIVIFSWRGTTVACGEGCIPDCFRMVPDAEVIGPDDMVNIEGGL